MNIFAITINDIRYSIPDEVLKQAFLNPLMNYGEAPISLDEQIKLKIIRPIVLVDINLLGGQTLIVNLAGLRPKYLDYYTMVYNIPGHLLNNRELLSVLSVGYIPFTNAYDATGYQYGQYGISVDSDVSTVGQRIFSSYASIPIVSNAAVDIIGYNTIIIREQFRPAGVYQVRCIVGNDENLNNLNPRTFKVFSELCVLAVKAYIYNLLVIRMGNAYLQGGMELGPFKDVVDSYSDANEQYRVFLRERWAKAAFMNDGIAHTRFIKS